MVAFDEVTDGETWELFARDFLQVSGYHVESTVDRGPDAGKDLIVVENLAGRFGSHPFRWLVSCKHNATSGSAVGESDERNLLERMRQHSADGFLGFYSTLASSTLNTRLNSLRSSRDLRDFLILDHRAIENLLITKGYNSLLFRYFPRSHRRVRPLHMVLEEYLPLNCAVCKKDLLEELYEEDYKGIVCLAKRLPDEEGASTTVEDVYWVHKGKCDRIMEDRWVRRGCVVGWEDISDLIIPNWYLRWVITTINQHRHDRQVYADVAHDNETYFICALSQKVFRDTTEEERDRSGGLWQIQDLMG